MKSLFLSFCTNCENHLIWEDRSGQVRKVELSQATFIQDTGYFKFFCVKLTIRTKYLQSSLNTSFVNVHESWTHLTIWKVWKYTTIFKSNSDIVFFLLHRVRLELISTYFKQKYDCLLLKIIHNMFWNIHSPMDKNYSISAYNIVISQ